MQAGRAECLGPVRGPASVGCVRVKRPSDSGCVLDALDDHVVDVAVGVAQLPAVVVAVVNSIGEAAVQPGLRRLARRGLVRETGRQRYRSRAIETIAAKLDTNDAVHEISVAATTEGRRGHHNTSPARGVDASVAARQIYFFRCAGTGVGAAAIELALLQCGRDCCNAECVANEKCDDGVTERLSRDSKVTPRPQVAATGSACAHCL